MTLDKETIQRINALASNEYVEIEDNANFSYFELDRIVDEFLATRACVIDEYRLEIEFLFKKYWNQREVYFQKHLHFLIKN